MSTEASTEVDLTQLDTQWTMLNEAHALQTTEQSRKACAETLERYRKAIKRYVRSKVGSAEDADEIYQNFSLRFLEGYFRKYDRERGRFRDYLKTALFNLVRDHHRKLKPNSSPLQGDTPEPVTEDSFTSEDDAEFFACWRKELIRRAMEKLHQFEQRTQRPLATALQIKMNHPDWSTSRLAEHFSAKLSRMVSLGAMRKLIMEARINLKECLIHEVYQTLDRPSLERVEEELIILGLFEFCRKILHR